MSLLCESNRLDGKTFPSATALHKPWVVWG